MNYRDLFEILKSALSINLVRLLRQVLCVLSHVPLSSPDCSWAAKKWIPRELDHLEKFKWETGRRTCYCSFVFPDLLSLQLVCDCDT